MAAKVRAKQRQLASSGPSLLQFTSTRTAADKALKDAETACEAALQVLAGALLAQLPFWVYYGNLGRWWAACPSPICVLFRK